MSIRETVLAYAEAHGPVTCRAISIATGVCLESVRRTVQDMVCERWLAREGFAPPAGRRGERIYVLGDRKVRQPQDVAGQGARPERAKATSPGVAPARAPSTRDDGRASRAPIEESTSPRAPIEAPAKASTREASTREASPKRKLVLVPERWSTRMLRDEPVRREDCAHHSGCFRDFVRRYPGARSARCPDTCADYDTQPERATDYLRAPQ